MNFAKFLQKLGYFPGVSLGPILMGLGCFSLLISCQSTPIYRTGEPCEIVFRDYQTGVELGLRNESLTSREKLYSQGNKQSRIKVISDPLMEYVVQELDREGFFNAAPQKVMPPLGGKMWIQGMGVRLGSKNLAWAINKGDPPQKIESFQKVVHKFLEIYNGTFQAKSLKGESSDYFKKKQKELEERRKNKGGQQ